MQSPSRVIYFALKDSVCDLPRIRKATLKGFSFPIYVLLVFIHPSSALVSNRLTNAGDLSGRLQLEIYQAD
jgi:hypothetical protein